MKKFFSEFKEFIAKGNVMDLAVGMIIGSTFTAIVNSVVNDILSPFVSLLTGKTSFEDMFVVLKYGELGKAADFTGYATLADAKADCATIVAYGNLIQLIINFIITALCVFLIVKGVNALRNAGKKAIEEKTSKEDGKAE